MSRKPRRWTEARLAQCQKMFESGMKTSKIGARFGITASTVSALAWQKKWQRKVRSRPAARRMVAVQAVVAGEAAAVEIAVTAAERNFNKRLQRTIAEYWRAQGRAVELHVEEQGGDLLGIRSKSVNGMPVKSS